MADTRARSQIKGAPMWLLLMELRAPLIALILTYAVSVLGLVFIPGETSAGEPYTVRFLDAFYIVSYTATTIGYGEIPYALTDMQRLWMLFVMYATVIAWLYSIGSVFSVLSDPKFRRLRAHQRSVRRIHHQKFPFWVLCGFGGAGSQLIRFLDQSGIRCVVVDDNQTRTDTARLSDLSYEVDVITGDVAEPHTLVDAGVTHPRCRGVLALTDQNQVNLTVATNVRVLAPRIPVYARSSDDANTRNLRSFDTEVVIDPDRVATHSLVQLIQRPNAYALYHELVDPDLNRLELISIPNHGHWIVCAAGRLARILVDAFNHNAVRYCLVSPEPVEAATRSVTGVGTEASTLRDADVASASGIIAATDDDGDNLSILFTALAEHSDLVTVARRNRPTSEPVFSQGNFSVVLREGRLIAQELFARIQTPLLHEFLGQLESMPEPLVAGIFQRLAARRVNHDAELAHFAVHLEEAQAPGVVRALARARSIALQVLLTDPGFEHRQLPAICLLVRRLNGDLIPFPGEGCVLREGDALLMWGEDGVRARMDWLLGRTDVFETVLADVMQSSTDDH
jgi:Trk K+ transport system NAD-binding subunit